MIENVCVNFKTIVLMSSLGMLLHGCATVGKLGSESWGSYDSAQELIDKKNLNEANGRAKDYVYAWGRKQGNAEPQSLYPRKYLSNYCSDQKGNFSLLYKSNFSLVKDARDRSTLASKANVKQGIGAYQCVQKDGKRWIVSIEPVSESASALYAGAREVALKTDLMGAEEARKFYRNNSNTAANNSSKKSAPVPAKSAASAKAAVKEVEEKKEAPAAEPVRAATVSLTPQQQQMKFYVDARRDINSGRNLNNACNNAQRAYNYGKLQGTEGTRVYTESGMLVARCLTSISTYSTRFPNAKGQAQRVLQNLSKNYNHAGAKRMLSQMK